MKKMAFPSADLRDPDGNGLMEGSMGMTLRQYYAGQALPAVLATALGQGVDPKMVAQGCLLLADALIELEAKEP